MSNPIEDLRENALYDTALHEIVEIMPPYLKESSMMPIHAVRELCIAMWIRGATWQRESDRRTAPPSGDPVP